MKPQLPLLLLFTLAIGTTFSRAQQYEPSRRPTEVRGITDTRFRPPPAANPFREPPGSQPGTAATVVPAAGLTAGQASESATAASAESTTEPSVTQGDIEAKVKEVNEATDLDETTKREALDRLKRATEWLKTAKESAEKRLKYEAEIASAPNDLEQEKRIAASPLPELRFDVGEATLLPAVEQAAAAAEERLKQAKELLVKSEDALKRRSERKPALTKLIPETEKAFDEAKKALATPQDTTSLLNATRRLELEAKYLALEQQKILFPLESKRLDAISELGPVQRDVAKRLVSYSELESTGWRKVVVDFRKRDSDREAELTRRQLQDADSALKSLAERNADLAEQRKAIVAEIEATSLEVKQLSEDVEKIANDFDKMQEKVEKAGNSTTIGLLLRRRREQLPDIRKARERLRFVSTRTPKIHLALLDLQDEEDMLDDRDSIAAAAIQRLKASNERYREVDLAGMVDEILDTREKLLENIIRDHDEYLRLLGEMEVAQKELVASTEQSQAFIDERVLWIRSSDPIGAAHFTQAWAEVKDLAQPTQWIALGTAIKDQVARQPLLAVLASLVVGMMLLCRGRFRRQINQICEADPEHLRGHFGPTVEALVASALATAFWPGLMLLIGWQLKSRPDVPELGHAIGMGLLNAAYLLWLCRFARQICRHDGIGVRHFEWNADSLAIARRSLSWLAAIGIPCLFFVLATSSYRDGEWSSFLGRVVFLFGMLTLACFSHVTLRAGIGIFREPCNASPEAWFCRLRHAIHFLGIGIPLALAVLAAMGYEYSAQHLAMRVEATISVLFGVILLRALALRWLQVRKFCREEMAASSSEDTADPLVEDNQDSELRYLLRYAVATALLLGGYFVWSDVAPALSVLDRFELWSELVEVKQIVAEADGTKKTMVTEEEVQTTLKHAVLACLILGLGMVVARNLPALVDVLILERMPADKGQRYAAGLILRYVLTLAAMVMACLTIGLSWSSIQWLAAAMTVGLGFGLQEIFANLVSGLIILFERPVRMGDLVTVGGVSGRVTRMQIRATTITDFERRELIVPNKKFITEDVMNWTLTDDVNRVLIEVGVAYGTNTELARELLLKVAREHPLTLDDPEPLATFDKFSDSSLNFTLRCFLPNLDNRLAVIHELHTEIDREFRQAQIEIAFPQQDLHVRTIETPLAGLLTDQQPTKDAA